MVRLLCAAPSAALPALTPGDVLRFGFSGRRLTLTVRATPHLLGRVASMLESGALVVPDDCVPTFDEIEADVESRAVLLRDRIDAALSRVRARQSDRAAG